MARVLAWAWSQSREGRIRTLAPLSARGSFGAHAYGLRYEHDLNGRVVGLTHPQQLAPVVDGVRRDVTRYRFAPGTGELKTVTDPLGGAFTYRYNPRGEVESLTLPRGMAEHYTYDVDGRLRQHVVPAPDGSFGRQNRLDYNAQGQIVYSANAIAPGDTLSLTHNGQGQVVGSFFAQRRYAPNEDPVRLTTTEQFRLDALGHRYYSSMFSETVRLGGNFEKTSSSEQNDWGYEAGTGRHLYARLPGLSCPLRSENAEDMGEEGVLT